MQLTDFEAMSFDCYGTLIDWEAGLSAVLTPWAREHGLDLTGEQLLAEYSGVEAVVEAGRPRDRYPDILARSMRLLGDRLGAEVTDEQAARLARSVPDWPAFADSRDALAALSKRVKLIILSNVDRASFAGSNARLGVEFTSIIRASGRANCCTWPRACSTIMCPPSGPACPRHGSTGGTPGRAGVPPRSRRHR
jgi:2-haloacid dehalogenase